MVHEEEDNFVKSNGIIYLLNDVFVAEILKGDTEQRSLEEATIQV
jgi:hypothetical protein